MYYYIKGKVEHITNDYIVLENNNIGYEIFTTTNTISNIKLNDDTKLYIYYHQKEDELKLFGFISENEKNMFLLLIQVNGIGPKSAIQILSSIPYNKLHEIIICQDVKTLSLAKGIGKKTAERIILELKTKMPTLQTDNINSKINIEQNQLNDESVEVLVALGYSLTDAKTAVASAQQIEKTTDKIVKVALQILSGGLK